MFAAIAAVLKVWLGWSNAAPPQYLPVVRSLIDTSTCPTPAPESVTVPQMPGVAQPGFQVVLSYEPLFCGNVAIVAGAAPSISTSIESLLVAATGFVTPLAALIDCTPGAVGELKVYVLES